MDVLVGFHLANDAFVGGASGGGSQHDVRVLFQKGHPDETLLWDAFRRLQRSTRPDDVFDVDLTDPVLVVLAVVVSVL